MTDAELWEESRIEYEWVMPRAAWWKRLPVIRYIRWFRLNLKVRAHYSFWTGQLGMIPTGYDNWVLFGIANGWERPLRD